jgi:hypothetical protein
MAISLASISKERAVLAPRIYLNGVEGAGKTTLASRAESPIFITPKGEKGTGEIDCHKFPPAAGYSDVIESISALYNETHDYRTVVIDSVSALEPLIHEQVCREAGVTSIEKVDGGYGKGYVAALNLWREVTEGLDALREDRGMTCVLIGHVVTVEFNDPEADPYTTYQSDLNKKAAALLYRWADAVLFAAFKKAVVQKNDMGFNKKVSRATGTGQRALYTEKRPAHPGKNRYGLPYELPLDWATLRQHIDKSQGAAANVAAGQDE